MPRGPLAEPDFVGRVGELEMISTCVASVLGGRPRLVWLEGDAGSGKTALLREVLGALPPNFQVVRAEADELVTEVAFDLLAQFGVHGATAVFPAALELLALWGALSADRPLAVVVEDLHWTDAQSRQALLGAFRRLGEDRVLVLVTSRPQSDVVDGWDRVCMDPDRGLRVRVRALSAAEVADLARRGGVALSGPAADRLTRHTGGNPLYVRTLLAELPPQVLAYGDGELPAPRSLASATVAKLAELPPKARALAQALAVVNQACPLPFLARVAGIEDAARALDDVVATDFVRLRPDEPATVQFSHPLYRAAVYGDLAPSLRKRLHLAAADVVDGPSQLRHRVAAADSVDDGLAVAAERAAQEAADQMQLVRASTYLLWASRLSSDPAEAEARLLRAARSLLAAEQTGRVAALRPQLEACEAGQLRSLVLGLLAWDGGDPVTAERLLRQATEPGDAASIDAASTEAVGIAAHAWVQLAVLFVTQIRGKEGVDAAERALQLPITDEAIERGASLAGAFGEAMLHGAPAGADSITRRLPQPAEQVGVADVDLLITRGALRYYAGRLGSAVMDLRAGARLARFGPSQYLARGHVHLCQALFGTGDWDEALVQGNVALSLLSDDRYTWMEGQAHAALATVLSARGEWERADEHLQAAKQSSEQVRTTEAVVLILVARASLAAARNEPQGVIECLTPLADSEDQGMAKISGLEWWPALIVALLTAGDVDIAAGQLKQLGRAAADRRLDFAARTRGLHARLSEACGEPERAVKLFADAVQMTGPDDPCLDRALLHHDFGRLLLARGMRPEGVGQLRAAQEILTRAKATPYQQRLVVDLDLATGTGPTVDIGSAVPGGARLTLTVREADVAVLVAKGMTNTEVAAELYVSANTVDYHLRHVFAKLGIRSRRELRKRLIA